MNTYQPDILGKDFERMSFELKDDYEGKVITTLIRKKTPSSTGKAILYIHGFNDYFFQEEEAERFISEGYDFYAIDLRKYGRSLLPHQRFNNCRRLEEYFSDIDNCLLRIGNEGIKNITLVAHSTGGLISALYLSQPGKHSLISSVIFNSPFLAMNLPLLLDKFAIPIVSFFGRYFPDISIKASLPSAYGESIHKDYKGEWDFNTHWKPIQPSAVNFGWIRAIHEGHKKIRKGIELRIPVLLLTSGCSTNYKNKPSDKDFRADGVLDVEKLHKAGKKIRTEKGIRIERIEKGLHDLALSHQEARDRYYHIIFDWLKEQKS